MDLEQRPVGSPVIGARALASMAIALVALGSLACEPAAAPAAPAGGGAPQVACQGVPDSICKQALETTGAAQGAVAQVIVRCSKPVCTERSGEADVLVQFRDGRQVTSNYGWESAPAVPAPIPVITPPPMPVQPDCQGVPFQQCIDMATSGLDGNTAAAVGKITVHCSAVCTPTSGSGETTYEFVDGRPSVTSSWNYEGGG
jgi:hypothetical protein